ncbi:MAG: glycosyltransferase family 4 protein [Thermoplasmataceae archaeon]
MRESYSFDIRGKYKQNPKKIVEHNFELSLLKTHFIEQYFLYFLKIIIFKKILRKRKIFEILNTLSWGPLVPKLYKLIADGDFDVVHSSIFPTATSVISFKACLDSGKPFVYTPYFHFLNKDFQNNPLLKYMIKKSTAVIACSNMEKRELIKLGAKESNTFVIPLSFDTDIIPLNIISQQEIKWKFGLEGYFVVLTHPWAEKGGVKVLCAIEALHKKGLKIAMISIGKTDREYLNQLKLILIENPELKILDFGWVEGRAKWELFSLCDAFALPSTSDAFGMSYLNAFALKKPILGAIGTPSSEIIEDGYNGVLVDPNNQESIISGLLKLYKSDTIILGMNGYNKLISDYNVKKMSEEYSRVFKYAMSV